ncbi:MAG: hypothetical protein IKH15_04885 [Bacteroidales bacterium]|nr:hypothetical protein [Bacteroidales bacterium]
MKQYLIPFLVGVAIVAIGTVTFQIGRAGGYQKGYDDALNLPHKADTIFKVDTLFIEKPVEKWREKIKEYYVEVPAWDTVTVHDTVFLRMPAERVQYEGEEYRAVVTGVEPKLESISVFPRTAYITNTVVQKKRWSWNVTAGAGVYWNGSQIQPGLGITAGFGYNF